MSDDSDQEEGHGVPVDHDATDGLAAKTVPYESDGEDQSSFDQTGYVEELVWVVEKLVSELRKKTKGSTGKRLHPVLCVQGCQSDPAGLV